MGGLASTAGDTSTRLIVWLVADDADLKFNKSSNTCHSASLSFPVTETAGLVICARIAGALRTRPRQTMASLRPKLAAVMSENFCTAASLRVMLIVFASDGS